MREILFRGFHADENGSQKIQIEGKVIRGEWVEGAYAKKINVVTGKDNYYIITSIYNAETNSSYFFDNLVIPSTVSQYIELNDKNGAKIFENDVIKCWSGEEDSLDYRELIGSVNYNTPYFRVSDNELAWCAEYFEIIGTIFDVEDKNDG